MYRINQKDTIMKTKNIKIDAVQFENGNILLSVSNGMYYVQTSDGVFEYNRDEMIEIYNYNK